MKIVFEPYSSRTNRYVHLMIGALRKYGHEVYSLSNIFKNPALFFKIKVVHLNWFENLNGVKSMEVLYSFAKQYLKINLLILFGKDIIWTMHNKIPHDQSFLKYKMLLLRTIIKNAKKIIIHSSVSYKMLINDFSVPESKIVYCPHPNYIGEYGEILESKTDEQFLNLLFIGSVKPYKNIELLLEVMSSLLGYPIKLKIVGKALPSYAQELLQKSEGLANVELRLEFIQEENMNMVLSECDLLVLPYDMASSLNSGTAILAFSYKKSVICPNIGTIMDIENKDCVFRYEYKDREEHKKNLSSAILKAYDIFRQEQLDTYSASLFKEMLEKNNIDIVGHTLNMAYN
ncbi:hypothetical protein A9P82_05935 [Arachidicoccus ginsenosidimutans]|uniref:glycosyltransferase n=1 Tax=Arachidicoccus sp. BS20 TaxID=1850526 RepID=UPI0007F1313D|nr:glycosyltransferase [Arachidicoccus sp. BS20]ANI88871.1 hypothetical protein A9P82_05935 [Arachidicoccus sp. BS20]